MAKTKAKSKINLAPAPGYILIEPTGAETKTSSGIYLPDSAGEKPQKGMVLAVGEACSCEGKCDCTQESPCKVGDEVIYKKWGGNEVKIEGKEYLFSKFEDILATVK